MSLRRGITALLVLGLAVITGVAVADVVRLRADEATGTSEPEQEPARAPPRPAAEVLRDAGAAGTIFVADTRCRVRGLRLPTLAEVASSAGPTPACGFAVTPRGAVLEGEGWYAPSRARAQVTGERVELVSDAGWVLRVDGRAPSWRPDGTLTVVRGAEVRAVDESCSEAGGDCSRLLLGERELRAAVPGSGDRSLRVRETAWLDDDRAALVLTLAAAAGAPPESVLGIWEGTRLVRALPGEGAGFYDLRPSPRGGFLTARVSDRPDNLLILDRDGREASPAELAGDRRGRPRFRFVRALALSPNERWVAIASRRGVYVFRRDPIGSPEVIRIRLNALDIVWH